MSLLLQPQIAGDGREETSERLVSSEMHITDSWQTYGRAFTSDLFDIFVHLVRAPLPAQHDIYHVTRSL